MTLGIVMLVHSHLDQAARVARHWASAGCPVILHVDKAVPSAAFAALTRQLADLPQVGFCKRNRCGWGTWGIVAATQAAATLMLSRHPQLGHVYLTSGSCLPLRPVAELVEYLAARPEVDFIESVSVTETPWTIGGLDTERFTLWFPLSWKRNRSLFDLAVKLQRKLGINRPTPPGVQPHIGSQWWCLSHRSLQAILAHPARRSHDRYFSKVWIPDESYFQTIIRAVSTTIESRSLTFSRFDAEGKPHVFYDDHLDMLRVSDCFVARKIWPHAQGLYDVFLQSPATRPKRASPNPRGIIRVFSDAAKRRKCGRKGLLMQSRYPVNAAQNNCTAAPYSILQGFTALFEDFAPWLERMTAARVHGHLFAQDNVQFAQGHMQMKGALCDSAALRDNDPKSFLNNLIWNTSDEHQCFQFGPQDKQAIMRHVAKDPNARISVISGAWAVPLFTSGMDSPDLRQRAMMLQKTEHRQLQILRRASTAAQVRIWTMADFIEAPMEVLQGVLDDAARHRARRLSEPPRLVDLTGFDDFLQGLNDSGMNLEPVGDVGGAVINRPPSSESPPRVHVVR